MDDNCPHKNCILSALRGASNGIYYGTRIRFVHTLVMTLLFQQGNIGKMINNIGRLTLEHAANLGTFAFLYKLTNCFLMKSTTLSRPISSGLAAGVVGSTIFRKMTPVNQQIILYLCARNLAGLTKLLLNRTKVNIGKFFTPQRQFQLVAALC